MTTKTLGARRRADHRPLVQETQRVLWQQAIAAVPDYALITSRNEWHERSELEPSVECSSCALLDTAAFSRRFRAEQRQPIKVVAWPVGRRPLSVTATGWFQRRDQNAGRFFARRPRGLPDRPFLKRVRSGCFLGNRSRPPFLWYSLSRLPPRKPE